MHRQTLLCQSSFLSMRDSHRPIVTVHRHTHTKTDTHVHVENFFFCFQTLILLKHVCEPCDIPSQQNLVVSDCNHALGAQKAIILVLKHISNRIWSLFDLNLQTKTCRQIPNLMWKQMGLYLARKLLPNSYQIKIAYWVVLPGQVIVGRGQRGPIYHASLLPLCLSPPLTFNTALPEI